MSSARCASGLLLRFGARGDRAELVPAAGVEPATNGSRVDLFVFLGALYVVMKLFGVEALEWTLVALFVAAPLVGIWAIKSGRFD